MDVAQNLFFFVTLASFTSLFHHQRPQSSFFLFLRQWFSYFLIYPWQVSVLWVLKLLLIYSHEERKVLIRSFKVTLCFLTLFSSGIMTGPVVLRTVKCTCLPNVLAVVCRFWAFRYDWEYGKIEYEFNINFQAIFSKLLTLFYYWPWQLIKSHS